MEIESCSLSLIGKFLTCNPFNNRAAKNTLKRALGLEDRVQIVEVGSNFTQSLIWNEYSTMVPGPFDNQLLMLTRWRRGMNAENVDLSHASL